MEIERKINDLTIEKWRFTSLMYGNIFLDEYYLLQKESKGHRTYKVLKKYSRIMSRSNTILESEVPLPDDLKKEVFDKFISEIKILKWSDK